MRTTVIAFSVVMGILLAALLCALALWIVEAVRKGYTPAAKPEKAPPASEQQTPGGAQDGETANRTDGSAQPHESAEAEQEKQPQGP